MGLPPWVPRKPKPPGKHVGGRYTVGSHGRSPFLPNSPWFRSRWERCYALFLEWQGIAWEYEPKKFVFESIQSGRNRVYTPDFWLPDEHIWHEVKGYLDRDSQIKLKRMAKYFPREKIIIIGKPFFASICAQGVCRLIDGYECQHHPQNMHQETRTYQEIPNPQSKRPRH